MHPLGRPASDGAHLAMVPCVRPRSPSHAQCVLLLCIRALQVTHSDNSIRAVDHYVHTARQLFKVHKANASTASAEQVIANVPKYGGRGGRGGVLSLPHNSPVLSPLLAPPPTVVGLMALRLRLMAHLSTRGSPLCIPDREDTRRSCLMSCLISLFIALARMLSPSPALVP